MISSYLHRPASPARCALPHDQPPQLPHARPSSQIRAISSRPPLCERCRRPPLCARHGRLSAVALPYPVLASVARPSLPCLASPPSRRYRRRGVLVLEAARHPRGRCGASVCTRSPTSQPAVMASQPACSGHSGRRLVRLASLRQHAAVAAALPGCSPSRVKPIGSGL
ncbi:uncharacterized protein LOC110437237 [Sorghum bicolor]|uniref:uncharacterized protein LOC110437237 n=1 Tax=Sorghum bicolor TaxID=4558 RepID=UPI000B425BB2|nr:uncharacterized protein LOC110437237 [Sorghum bicolor]|eukprot:XP_021321291.1 uncharacterized protein LOC110437237 [Sorghum bicolor]